MLVTGIKRATISALILLISSDFALARPNRFEIGLQSGVSFVPTHYANQTIAFSRRFYPVLGGRASYLISKNISLELCVHSWVDYFKNPAYSFIEDLPGRPEKNTAYYRGHYVFSDFSLKFAGIDLGKSGLIGLSYAFGPSIAYGKDYTVDYDPRYHNGIWWEPTFNEKQNVSLGAAAAATLSFSRRQRSVTYGISERVRCFPDFRSLLQCCTSFDIGFRLGKSKQSKSQKFSSRIGK